MRLKLWVHLHLLPVLAVPKRKELDQIPIFLEQNLEQELADSLHRNRGDDVFPGLGHEFGAGCFGVFSRRVSPGFLIAEHLVEATGPQSPVGVDVPPEHRADDPVLEPRVDDGGRVERGHLDVEWLPEAPKVVDSPPVRVGSLRVPDDHWGIGAGKLDRGAGKEDVTDFDARLLRGAALPHLLDHRYRGVGSAGEGYSHVMRGEVNLQVHVVATRGANDRRASVPTGAHPLPRAVFVPVVGILGGVIPLADVGGSGEDEAGNIGRDEKRRAADRKRRIAREPAGGPKTTTSLDVRGGRERKNRRRCERSEHVDVGGVTCVAARCVSSSFLVSRKKRVSLALLSMYLLGPIPTSPLECLLDAYYIHAPPNNRSSVRVTSSLLRSSPTPRAPFSGRSR